MDNNSSSTLILSQETKIVIKEENIANEDSFINSNSLITSSTLDDDDEEEYIEMLIDREITFDEFKKSKSFLLDNWLKCARLEAITWILKTRAMFGFRFQTAYMAVSYFDQFLTRRSINIEKSWAAQLLSVACLSLAAKMEEIRIPLLTEFEIESFNFESKVIQRMELLVLNTLEWKMGLITPFVFINYFINKFNDSPSTIITHNHDIVSTTVHLLLSTMREINLMEHKPSVMAAAATLVALGQRLTRTALDPISVCGFLKIEEVNECYNIMHQSSLKQMCSSASGVSLKRKAIIFNNSDQSHDGKRLC